MNTTFIRTRGRHFSLAKKLFCAALLLLGSSVDVAAQWTKIGTGTTSNTVSSYPTPFGNKNAGQRAQYLYRASELNAAGIKPGWINGLGFLVTNTNGSVGHTGMQFSVGSASGSAVGPTGSLASVPWQTGLELRYANPLATTVALPGVNNFNFSKPYYWNGVDNIVVGTCFFSGIPFNNASVEFTEKLGFNASRTLVVNTTGSIGVCDAVTAPTTTLGEDSTSRPNIYFRVYSDTCSAKPVAGMATSSKTDFCLTSTDSIDLNLVGNSLSVGLRFQWQRSPSATGPWSNLGAGSTTVTNRKTLQTASTYYRCIVSCVAKSLNDTSVAVFVPQAPPYNCDCNSSSKNTTDEKILNVSLSGLTNSTPCGPLAKPYEDFTGTLPPAELEPGTDYTLNMRLGTCGTTDNARAVKVFIDFNQNAVYEVSEMVYANTYSPTQPSPQNATGTFTTPLTAKTGLTGMRIIYAQAASLAAIDPCTTYNFGETQDYAINILPFGKPTVSGLLTVCEHDSVVMNVSSIADTPVIFSWTGPGGFTGIGPKITFVDASPALSGIYYVTATSGGRTSTPREVTVIVYPKPLPPNLLNPNICQYEADGTLKTDGKNVLWYNVPVGGFGDTAAPKLPTHTPNVGTFYVTQTVNGCVSDRIKVVVNILLKPAPPVVKSPVTYCQLQDPELVAKGEGLKWYLDSSGGVPTTISPIPPTGFADEISYYVSQTVNGCESDRARVRVTVYEQPNGIILHTRPFSCQYDTVSFVYYGNAPVSDDYKWLSVDGTLESGGGHGPVVFRFNSSGDKIVSLFVNNGKCATIKISDTITVRPAPAGSIDTVYNACVGVPVTISMDTATHNSDNYMWDWNGGTLVSETVDGGPYNVVWNTPGTKNLTLVIHYRTCPSLPITQSLFVHDHPFAKIVSWEKVTNNGKDTNIITEKLCSRDTVVFTAYKDASYKYKWYPDYYFDMDTTNVVADRMRVPAFIRVDVESQFGCKASDSVYINAEACCEMAFPNAFTPNGDDKNDIYKPIRDGRQDIVTYRIVNRWGQVVFESANTDSQGWDGMFAGKPQDMGVYQYYIKYRCLDGVYYEKKGDITLIR